MHILIVPELILQQGNNNFELSELQLEKLVTYIAAKTGMVFASRLKSWVIKQFETVFKESGVPSLDVFLMALTNDQLRNESQALFERLTVHETMFYRDAKYFEFLRTTMFPKLIESKKTHKTLSLWVAAGSSGQEAYSILFTIFNNFPELVNWNIKIYSTDISTAIIKKAKEGTYESHEIERGLDEVSLNKFFNKLNEKYYQVKAEYRSKVTFMASNLVENFSHLVPSMDFISCRNVLIYFDQETKMDIVKRLTQKLNPNGFLLLGQVDYINCKLEVKDIKLERQGSFPYFVKTTS